MTRIDIKGNMVPDTYCSHYNSNPGQALAYANFTKEKVQLSKWSVLPSSECIAIH